MPSSPLLVSSDSGGAGTLSYPSDLDTGFLADPSTSPVLGGSPDFSRRLHVSESGFGSRSQGTGVMFPASSVCPLASLECLSRSSEALRTVAAWCILIQSLVRPFPGLPS